MDFKRILSNPWVIGGAGVLIGLVFLMPKGSSGGADPTAFISAAAASNQAGYAYSTAVATNAAMLAKSRADSDASLHAMAFATVNNFITLGASQAAQMNAIRGSIVESQIEAETYKYTSDAANANRLSMAAVQSDLTKFIVGNETQTQQLQIRKTASVQRAQISTQRELGEQAQGNQLGLGIAGDVFSALPKLLTAFL